MLTDLSPGQNVTLKATQLHPHHLQHTYFDGFSAPTLLTRGNCFPPQRKALPPPRPLHFYQNQGGALGLTRICHNYKKAGSENQSTLKELPTTVVSKMPSARKASLGASLEPCSNQSPSQTHHCFYRNPGDGSLWKMVRKR